MTKTKGVARKRPRRESLREQLTGAWECLDMVREALEGLGTDMQGTPPTFYPEAIRSTAWRLLGMFQRGEIVYDATRKSFHRADGTSFALSPERGSR